jgi:hypothetical protein
MRAPSKASSFHSPQNEGKIPFRARLAVKGRDARASSLSEARACEPPATRGRKASFLFLNVINNPKNAEKLLDFSVAGCIISSGNGFRCKGFRLPSSFSAVFHQKSMKTDQVLLLILLILRTKYQQEHCVSVSAGRFSVVSGSGSWSDLHTRVWGSVRLFYALISGVSSWC